MDEQTDEANYEDWKEMKEGDFVTKFLDESKPLRKMRSFYPRVPEEKKRRKFG